MAHPSGGCPPQTSSASRSIDTTRFASSSSSASTARCRGPPSGTARPDRRDLQRSENAELREPRLGGHRLSSHHPPARLSPSRRASGFRPFHHQIPPPVPSRGPSRSQGNSGRHALLCQCGQRTGHPRTSAQAAEGATPMNHQPAPSQPRPHPEPDARWARRAGGLPGRRHRPGPAPRGQPPRRQRLPLHRYRHSRPPPQRPRTSRRGPSRRSWPQRSSCPSPRPSSPWRWNTPAGPAAKQRPSQNPAPAHQAEILSSHPARDRA